MRRGAACIHQSADYHGCMSTKEMAIRMIDEMPEEVSWADIEERIRFVSAIDKARDEARRGEIRDHAEVREQLDPWITG